MGLVIQDGLSANLAGVDSLTRQLVTVPKTQDSLSNPTNLSGGDRAAVEVDAGLVVGTPTNRALTASEFRRLAGSLDHVQFHEFFNGTFVNTAQWNQVTATMTVAVAGGKLSLNTSSSTAVSTYAVMKSYRNFPIYSGFPTVFEAVMTYTAASAGLANNLVELGMGFATTSTTPTDGVFFRWNYAGNFVCVVNFNGTETISSPLTPPTINVQNQYKIVIGLMFVEFWVNGILQTKIATPTGAGNPVITQNLPILYRVVNNTIAPTYPVSTSLYSVTVYNADHTLDRPFEITMAGLGAGSFQGQTGQTMGSTGNHTNSTAAVAATLSNTAAGYSKLGGKFLFSTLAGAATDYALFGFQVPVASVNIPGKTLYIRGIHISCMNIGAAVATTATVLQWSLGVGATAVSLATTEASNAKAPRVVDLGFQTFPIGAAIGQMPQNGDLDVQFPYPLMVEQGGYVHVILNLPIGTATASQQIQGTVLINGIWE